MFIKTSGLAVAGLGLPAMAMPETDASSGGASQEKKDTAQRKHPEVSEQADYVVVGGGIAGVCSAITAARAGLKVVLIQDRPVLGGNASSEVRLWILGATCHMGTNARWAREGGVHEEIVVENMYRNREGNPVFFDALLLEKVWAEPNITLLLNTAVYSVEMAAGDRIGKVIAFCSQNQTQYVVSAPLFCDASGDGIVGFLASAAFRMGAEPAGEFGEKFIMPDDYGTLLGHSMYFYSKDAGRPVKYVAPAFALKDIPGKIPRFKDIHRDSSGCRLWWLEWGDDLDRVFDSEKIKDELWRVVYGVWDYIKNSGTFKDVDNLTLEWVSTIPGKRESRRFEGDYILNQWDVAHQTPFDDAIAYGGWGIDLHPAKGVYSSYPGCTQYHNKGIYTIPYRCIYSRNISNLFIGGRLTSVSHVAFGSTRVISTGTLCAQTAALAAGIMLKNSLSSPREVLAKGYMSELQQQLMQTGHYIPGIRLTGTPDLVKSAKITPSATYDLSELPGNGQWRTLDRNSAMLLPLTAGKVPVLTFPVRTTEATDVRIDLFYTSKPGNYTPDVLLASKTLAVPVGTSSLPVDFKYKLKTPQYVLVVLNKNEKVSVEQSDVRLTGVLSLFYSRTQKQDDRYGIEEVPYYPPERRPGGKNLALKASPAIRSFEAANLLSGIFRPAADSTNAWAAPLSDKTPSLHCAWSENQTVEKIILWFDSDFDHAMESCLMGHPEDVMPFCVQKFRITDDAGNTVYECSDNRHSRVEIRLEKPVSTSSLTLECYRAHENVPVSVFGIQMYG
ncbi:MAG: FAD-dependent oxidoreductase [Tannerella sp.]|nr:FAD-dependent oxidoreductase [Tannerella sp.]